MDLKNFSENTTDEDFDSIFKSHISSHSNLHWTPLKIARTAAKWLCTDDSSKILDIGSGVGKFCTVGALTTNGNYIGVEKRGNLVNISNVIIQQNKIKNVEFINDNFTQLDFSNYTGFYLYNPFWENIANDCLIDNKIPISEALYQEYNKILSIKLSALQPGVLVATYLIREEDIPLCFTMIKHDFKGNLILWRKTK